MFFNKKELYEKDEIIQNLEHEKLELSDLVEKIRACNELCKKQIDSLEQEKIELKQEILLQKEQFDEEIEALKTKIIVLQTESDKLKRNCLEIEQINVNRKSEDTTLRNIKSKLLQLSQDKGFYEYEYFFLKTDTDILSVIEDTENLLQEIEESLEYYDEFRKLYLFKNEIFSSSFKILMLLQMIDREAVLDLEKELQKMGIENDINCLQKVRDYNKLFDLLIHKTNYKEDFYKAFSLYLHKETQSVNEKEKRKMEIRDNTIMNFYNKYGEKMFQEQNMRILKENLKKVGINIISLTKIEIRQIVNKRKLR